MTVEVIMPEMGEGIIEGKISRWLKSEGDEVKQYDPLLEVETDKVTTEVVAEQGGTLAKITAQAGETFAVGTVLALIVEPGGAMMAIPVPVGGDVPISAEPVLTTTRPQQMNGHSHHKQNGRRTLGRISPVVARMADEHDLDLKEVDGTGRNGRITKHDVLAHINTPKSIQSTVSPPEAVKTPSPTGSVPAPALPRKLSPKPEMAHNDTLQPLTSMRRSIAEHMLLSKRISPHVTTVFEVDFSRVMAHRKAHKADFAKNQVRLTLTPYIIMATARALRVHPHVNSSWTDDGLLYKGDINIGMAAAVPEGLIVPVIKHADELSLLGMARRVNDLAERSRLNRLTASDISGGTFTVTNHGTSGSLIATPIINQPQAGILGIGRIQKRVVVLNSDGGDIMAIRPMAYVSFTLDHRVLDGATADYFVSSFKEVIENWS